MRSNNALIFIALSVIGFIVSAFFIFDRSTTRESYGDWFYIQRVLAIIGAVFCLAFTYISYTYYKTLIEEEFTVITPVKTENLNMKPSQNGQKCPKCSSKNVILDGNKIYCLDCGEISKMVIK